MDYVYRTDETYARNGRAIEGTVPAIRLADCTVLVVSMGRPATECAALADKIAEFLKALGE